MTQWKCSFQKFCWQLSFQCGKLVLKPLFLTRRGERSNLVQTDTLSAWISHKLPHRTFVIQPFFFTLGKKKFFFLPTFNRDLTSTYQTEYYLVIVAWCLSEVLDSLESVMLIIYLLVEFLYNECSIFDY